MNLKELRELYSKLTKEFDDKKENAPLEELRELNQKIQETKERIELIQAERDLNIPERVMPEKTQKSEVRDLSIEELDKEYEETFLRAFRGKKLSERDHDVYRRMLELRDAPNATSYFKSGTDADGGFIIPKSISTLIEQYKREFMFDLTSIVDVQKTSVMSGEFTYEKLADITPFAKLSQWDNIEEIATPQFERKSFTIEDYAGILPIPNTLLQDTDQNLMAYIAKFIARKQVVTRNAEIIKVLNATYSSKTPVATIDDIKNILNVKLDVAFLPSAVITTNQDGFNILDKMKDTEGKYLLQPDPVDATKKMLLGHPLRVLSNVTLKTESEKAPFIVGDIKSAIRFMDRDVFEVTPTKIGGHAFIRNSLDIRVIDRFDVISTDKDAVIYGELTVS